MLAALVLQEVFECTAAEIAELLDTPGGAVKAELHRGRSDLAQIAPRFRHARPDKALLARFVDAFNAAQSIKHAYEEHGEQSHLRVACARPVASACSSMPVDKRTDLRERLVCFRDGECLPHVHRVRPALYDRR